VRSAAKVCSMYSGDTYHGKGQAGMCCEIWGILTAELVKKGY